MSKPNSNYIYLMYFLAANSLWNLKMFHETMQNFDLIVYGMNIDATWLNSSTSSTLPRVNVMLHQALQGKLRLVDVNLPLLQMNHQSPTACIKYIFER